MLSHKEYFINNTSHLDLFWIYLAFVVQSFVCYFQHGLKRSFTKTAKLEHNFIKRSSSFFLRNNQFTTNDFDLICIHESDTNILRSCKITQFDTVGFQTDVKRTQCTSCAAFAHTIEHCTVCVYSLCTAQSYYAYGWMNCDQKAKQRLFLGFNFRHRLVHANVPSKYTPKLYCGVVLLFSFVCYRAHLLISFQRRKTHFVHNFSKSQDTRTHTHVLVYNKRRTWTHMI